MAIDVKNIDKKTGFDMHDLLRDGRSPELDPVKVSAVINALVTQVNALTKQQEEDHKLIEHMRNRSKPGPKLGTKWSKNTRKGK